MTKRAPKPKSQPLTIGVISDTHGLLRPEAIAALSGVDHILHAGDVGDPLILDKLRWIAPLTAVRGNIDTSGVCHGLPESYVVELAGRYFYLVHSVHDVDLNPKVAGIAMVVSGHTHRAQIEERDGVIYLNPGSAGPRRFDLPITLAKVIVADGALSTTIITLL